MGIPDENRAYDEVEGDLPPDHFDPSVEDTKDKGLEEDQLDIVDPDEKPDAEKQPAEDEEAIPSKDVKPEPDVQKDSDPDVHREADEGDSRQRTEFDPEILSMARQLGIPERIAKRMPSLGALEEALAPLAFKYQQEHGGNGQQTEEPAVFKVELDPDVDETIVAQFTSMNDHYVKQFDQQNQQLQKMAEYISGFQAPMDQMMESLVDQRATLLDGQMDAFYESISDEHGTVFGSGKTASLKAGSGEAVARQELRDKADMLASGHIAMNPNNPPDVEQVMKEALLLTQGSRIKERARKAVESRHRDQKGRYAQRSERQTVGDKGTPEDRAVAALTEKFAQMGIPATG